MLSKESIFQINDVQIVPVDVPEWYGSVCVKTITAKDQDVWSAEVAKQKKESRANFQASFLVMCICDESGTLLFSRSDADALGNKSAGALNRIFNVASRINGLSESDVKELEKNSVTVQGEDSTSN
jgi:hypothetical protein